MSKFIAPKLRLYDQLDGGGGGGGGNQSPTSLLPILKAEIIKGGGRQERAHFLA